MYDGPCQHALFAHKFTGKERDSESGLDNFGARYYGSNLGRFTSTDPKMISLKRMLDPQQWTMYTYARNNPIGMVDPDGREVKVAADLQPSFDRLMKSSSFRNAVAPYQGPGKPDLTIQRGGNLGHDELEPNRKKLGVTSPSIAPSIQNCSSATDCTTIPAKLKSTTIKIDDSVSTGKGKEDTEGVMAHEVSHANDAITNPQEYLDEKDHDGKLLHDDRPEEQRADQLRDKVRKEVKDGEKKERHDKKEKD